MAERSLLKWLAASATVVAALTGCSHEVTSPQPTIDADGGIAPRVVCTEQHITTISVRGSNFTPMPIRALGGVDGGSQPQTLQLPSISLAQAATLSGTPTARDGGTGDGGASTFRIFDDYDHPLMSHVAWTNERAMAFDIYPNLMLIPGVYDLTVENPDGVHRVTANNAIAAVPPPHLTAIMPPSICVAQMDQMVTLTGTGFLRIGTAGPTITVTGSDGVAHTYMPTAYAGCMPIAQTVQPDLQSCTGVTFTIPAMSLQPGTYSVVLTNPPPADCHSTEAISLIVAPPPHVTSVTPATICQGGGSVTVSGTGFQNGATVTLGTAAATPVVVTSGTQLTATWSGASAMFTPGTVYDLTVTNPDGCHDTLMNAVTAVPGPVVFFADPPVVYNGITTSVTLYSTSVTPPLMTVTITLHSGGTPITLTSTIDPTHPHHIISTVPNGTPAGTYDITVTDGSGCPATLANGLRVVDTTTLTITSIDPPFGWQNGTTAVTINASGGLMPTPRAYLSPHTNTGGTLATALSSVAFVSATRLTAIVPQGVNPSGNPYDLIIVNPDGTVGVLTTPTSALYQSLADPPPLIDGISPSTFQIPLVAGASLTITGQNFRTPTVAFTCTDATGTHAAITQTVAAGGTATQLVLSPPNFGTTTAPAICTIRVTNTDTSYADFSAVAITNSGGNLLASAPGPAMPVGRRAPAVLAAEATRAAHFLYAIGGDNGTTTGALNTVATIDTNERGYGTTWFTQRYALSHPRTLAGYASLGRYLYVVGGNTGTAPDNTVERAMVLDPVQAPHITDVDIVPGMGTGLGGGIWYYRVAAVMPATDADNPSGETLPSDEFPIQIPDLTQRLQVRLTWTAVPGAAGYVVYRTPTPGLGAGQEELLATITSGATVTYNDTGTATMATAPRPLPLGSTGTWKVLPNLTTARESNVTVIGVDPTTPNTYYLYATGGRAAAPLASYEFLTITVNAATGQQTNPAAWTAGSMNFPTARFEHYAYSANHANISAIPAGTNYVYVGGGWNGTTDIGDLWVATVQNGGQLGPTWTSANSSGIHNTHGGGYAAIGNSLYRFGNEPPDTAIFSGTITAPPAVNAINSNGGGVLGTARGLLGVAIQDGHMFIVGGHGMTTAALDSVEAFIW